MEPIGPSLHALRALVAPSITACLVLAACGRQSGGTPPREGFITVSEGVRLYYRVAGAGGDVVIAPIAVFLAGELDFLGKRRTVVTYDPPGRGSSDAIDTMLVSVDRNVEFLEQLRAGLGISRMSLIGWSGLGKEVAVYAIRYPHRVQRLIQLSPVPPSSDTYPLEAGLPPRAQRVDRGRLASLERRRAAGEFDADSAGLCRSANAITFPADFADARRASEVADVCAHRNEWPPYLNAYFRRIVGTQGKHDWRDSIRVADIPRLVIHGRQDPIPISGARAWVAVAGDPRARLLEVDSAGHFAFIEQRAIVQAAIETFLGGKWPAGAIALPPAAVVGRSSDRQ